MDLYTSTYNYNGDDRFDITIKSNNPIGHFFAPTPSMLLGYKSGNCNVDEYTRLYENLMNESIKKNPSIWNYVLDQEKIVLVCFCKKTEFCHRFLLAEKLKNMGAIYYGEIDA